MNKLEIAILNKNINEIENQIDNYIENFLIPLGKDKNCIYALPIMHLFNFNYAENLKLINKEKLKKVINYTIKNTKFKKNELLFFLLSLLDIGICDDDLFLYFFEMCIKNLEVEEYRKNKTSKEITSLLNKIYNLIEGKYTILTKKHYLLIYKLLNKIDYYYFKEMSTSNNYTFDIMSYINLNLELITNLKYNKKLYAKNIKSFLTREKKDEIFNFNLKDLELSKVNLYINKRVLLDNYTSLFTNEDNVFNINAKNYIKFLNILKLDKESRHKKNDKEEDDLIDEFIDFTSILTERCIRTDKDFKIYLKEFDKYIKRLEKINTENFFNLFSYEPCFFDLLSYNNYKFYDSVFLKYKSYIHKILFSKMYFSKKDMVVKLWNSLKEENLINSYNIKEINTLITYDTELNYVLENEYKKDITLYEKSLLENLLDSDLKNKNNIEKKMKL